MNGEGRGNGGGEAAAMFEAAVQGGQGQAQGQGAAEAKIAALFAPPAAAPAGPGLGELPPPPAPIDPIFDRLGPDAAQQYLQPQPPQAPQGPSPDGSPAQPLAQPDPATRVLLEQQAAQAQLIRQQMEDYRASAQQQMEQAMRMQQESFARVQAIMQDQALTPEQRQSRVTQEWQRWNNRTPDEMVQDIMKPVLDQLNQKLSEYQQQLTTLQAPLAQFQRQQTVNQNMARLSQSYPELRPPNPADAEGTSRFNAFRGLMFSPQNVNRVVTENFSDPNLTPEQIFESPYLLSLLASNARAESYRAFGPQAQAAAQLQTQMATRAAAPMQPGSRGSAQPPQGRLSPEQTFKQTLLTGTGKSFDQAVADAGSPRR